MRRLVPLCTVVLLLGGCGSTSKPKHAEPQTEGVHLRAKQFRALPREINTLTPSGWQPTRLAPLWWWGSPCPVLPMLLASPMPDPSTLVSAFDHA
jgi:hypothetical protein